MRCARWAWRRIVLPQVREGHRRGHRQLPPARRRAGLRHTGAPGAGLQHALRPGRRPGQLRFGRWRSAGRLPLYRGSSRGAGRRDDRRPRQGDCRLRSQLRRDHGRTDSPPDDLSEPARQRLVGHRRRHGHQYPAAQHAGSDRRCHRADRDARASRREARLKAVLKTVPGPDFPTGGFIVGRHGIFNAYTTGRGSLTLRAKATTEESKKGDKIAIVVTEIPVPGQQDAAAREHRRARPREGDRGHFRICATSPIATACASSSS